MTVQHRNYQKLRRLLPNLDQLRPDQCLTLESGRRVPLSVIVQLRQDERLLLTIGHYSQINRDPVPNPEMALLVDLGVGSVEALSYRDPSRHSHRRDRDVAQARLDDFLSLWLSNLRAQRYEVTCV